MHVLQLHHKVTEMEWLKIVTCPHEWVGQSLQAHQQNMDHNLMFYIDIYIYYIIYIGVYNMQLFYREYCN